MPDIVSCRRQAILTRGIDLLLLVLLLLVGSVTDVPAAHALPEATSEVLLVQFVDGPVAVTSQLEYTGPVTIIVSGVGQASASQYSDAFYLLTDNAGNLIDPSHPTLPYNWVLWINGQHAEDLIVDQLVPSYTTDHTYTLVISAPGGRLTFGVGDTYTTDNSGSYTIAIGGDPTASSVPFLSQRDPRWTGHPLRTNGECSPDCGTIGSCGCTLTSAAMVFAHYGSDLTPLTLSDCMGTSACKFQYGTATSCTGGKVKYVGRYTFSWEQLDAEINAQQRPVILGMHIAKPPWTHAVVVTYGHGSSPNNYLVHDPYPPNGADTNLAALSRQGYVFDSLIVYDKQPDTDGETVVSAISLFACNPTGTISETLATSNTELSPGQASASAPIVTGTVIVYHVYETSLLNKVSAVSTDGDVNSMQVWTDSSPTPSWRESSSLAWVPWQPGDRVYARFRDALGNVSEVYSDSISPMFGPPPEYTVHSLYLPLVIGP